jgi:thioredoxin 1
VSNSKIVHTSDAAFESDVLKSETPVLVDFWAEWCGPCKAIAPVLEQVADAYGDKVRIAKLNVDENSATAAKFNIRSIPALLLFQKGALVAHQVGSLSQSQLRTFLDAKLGAAAA